MSDLDLITEVAARCGRQRTEGNGEVIQIIVKF